MPIILLILLIFSYHFNFNLNNYFTNFSKIANLQCNETITSNSHYSGLFQSFLCGNKLEKSLPKDTLIKAGIYHLIVVSGGHFLFLDYILNFLKFPLFLRCLFLFVYYLATGLQAPGFRALTHILFSILISFSSVSISRLNKLLFSGIICLILNNSYWISLSFWLSFSVCLALTTSKTLFFNEKPINKFIIENITIYIFLMPFLTTLSYSHPLTLFIGSILATPSFYFLTLSTLLIFIFKIFHLNLWIYEYDKIIKFYFDFLDQVGSFSSSKNNLPWSWSWFWTYLFILFIFGHFIKVILERKSTHV